MVRVYILISILTSNSCSEMNIEWNELTPLPPAVPGVVQPGLAGPYAGLHGDVLIVAGGANFSDAMPWNGGAKSYHSEVYAMQMSVNGGSWVTGGPVTSMPAAIAYGSSVSLPAGVICMGGETEAGLSDSVFMISGAGDKIIFTTLPSLPKPLSSTVSGVMGSKVFLAGGISPEGPSAALYCLDTDEIGKGWIRLCDMPLALINSVMVPHGSNELWAFGGRTREIESDTSVIRPEIFRYQISEDRWTHEGMITNGRDTLRFAAGTGATVNDNLIALFGGNDGSVFTRVEKLLSEIAREKNPTVAEGKRTAYISLQETHPGFSREVILFNTETRQCKLAGEIPGPAQVTTVAIESSWGIIIPSGEIRPGIRTPQITLVRFN